MSGIARRPARGLAITRRSCSSRDAFARVGWAVPLHVEPADDDVFGEPPYYNAQYQGGRPLNNTTWLRNTAEACWTCRTAWSCRRLWNCPSARENDGRRRGPPTSLPADDLSAIATYESGQPLNVTQNADNSGRSAAFSARTGPAPIP